MNIEAGKILHIIAGLNDGGAEAVLYRLCNNDTRYTHYVISMMDVGKYGPLLKQAGIEVHYLNMPQGRVSMRGLLRLWSLLRELKPDVVQTWMYHADLIGGVVARLAGVKSVFWGIRHTTLEPGKSKRSTIYVARLCAFLSRWVPDKIVCCANKAVEVHVKLGYSAHKMTVIPNGYDLKKFFVDYDDRKLLRNEWGIDETIPLLGMVGRFDPQKDHKNLINALGTLRQSSFDFCFVLIGKNLLETNQELVAWIDAQDLRENIILLGQRSDIPQVMNALDAHVLSSSYGEAFPNVLAEAMACGTPCVTTDVGDAALIVGDTGWVVEPKNAEALATALLDSLILLHDEPAWMIRKQQARERIVNNFCLEKMINDYHTVWNGESRLT